MDINGFGLLNSIGAILNSERHDSDYAIAQYLVSRLGTISSISIKEIIEHAFVTRSAVRRFCNRLGFSSFSEFARNITEATYPSDIAHRDLSRNLASYRKTLDTGIQVMFCELGEVLDDETITTLAHDIHESDGVILACANNTSGVLDRFQQELLFAGKLVRVISESYDAAGVSCDCQSESLLLSVSASGVFARGSRDWMTRIPSDRRLITASHDADLSEGYNRVYYLSKNRTGLDGLGIYGKYGVAYFFDLLSACYLNLYAAHQNG